MERRSVSDLIRELQPLLRKFENDDRLVLDDVREEAGCKIGDNYMSVVMRADVRGRKADGTNYSKSLMTKYLPGHREIATVIGFADLFKNESHYYQNILPKLGDFGPICIHADVDKVIMEDLKSKGYVSRERRQLLDLEHASAVVRRLAKLHASSLSLKLRDKEEFAVLAAPLKDPLFTSDSRSALGMSTGPSIDSAIKHLESLKARGREIELGIDYLRRLRDVAYDAMHQLLTPGQRDYDVLTHGDAWKNNLMFRYDETDGDKVIDVKFIDFQVVRHTSVASDFHYFVYTSLECDVIADRYDDLVRSYHAEFAKTLEDRRVPRSVIDQLSLEWFRDELRRYKDFAIVMACWLVSVVIVEDHEAVDMDKVTIEQLKSQMTETPINPKIAERLKCVISDFVRRYIQPSPPSSVNK